MPSAGRCRGAGRRRSPMPSPPSSVPTAARSSPARPCRRSPTCPPPASPCSTSVRASSCGSPATGCREVSPSARALPPWPRRLQDRRRARWTHSVAGGGLRAGGHRPPRRHPGRDRGRGIGGLARPASGAAVRAPRAAEPLRLRARARGPAHAVGLLPRAERIDGGHDRSHPRPGGTLRAGPARSHPFRPPGPAALERANANYVGGDIGGGAEHSTR